MTSQTQPRHQRPTKLKKFLFGAPYYPEHWTDKERAGDPELMARAGVNVVRMAEFAWDRIEPSRGKFVFSLFDETIARLGRHGIGTILCTPTATPPRWLTADHPEWMRVDADGRPMEHGSRQHVCTANDDFRTESRRITAAMAEHYKADPNVIGWQTDNEFYCHFSECYCRACQSAFRVWLKKKYGAIAKLNAAWGTAFWALTFDSFDQVPLPYPKGRPTHPNPSHLLDYYRFLSDMLVEFQAQQVDILRRANADWFVTHNGMMGHIDYWRFTQDLDFLGVDVYPGFSGPMPRAAAGTAYANEKCRAASGNYIIPEQQGGPGGQGGYMLETPRPGQMRLWAYQGVAHGADGVLHFRWRTCRFGAEIFWYGILDHDNIPRRRYEEFSREGAELACIGPKVLGTVPLVKAAMLIEHDQQDAWSTISSGLPSSNDMAAKAFHEMWNRHLPCGLVHAEDSLAGLKFIYVPSFVMMDEALAGKLAEFVRGGGVLLTTARTATRNRDNRVISQSAPGLLREVFGVTIEEFGKLNHAAMKFKLAGRNLPAGPYYEVLGLHGAKAKGKWMALQDGGPHGATGTPAVAINSFGKGKAIYIGTYLDDKNVADIFDLALGLADIAPLAKADPYVEIACRAGRKGKLTFVLNHYAQPKQVSGLPKGANLISGKQCGGRITVEPFGVAVIESK